jgi:hypothetical protein
MTRAYVTKSGLDRPAAKFREPALEEIEAFISCLPSGPYRYLAVFVLATAADPETAVGLQVQHVKSLWAEFGTLGAMEKLANVLVDPEWELLLPIYIRGKRAAIVRRLIFPKGEEPTHVYLGRSGRPLTVKNANAALARISKRMNFDAPITLDTIARAVILSRGELLTMPMGTSRLQ